MSKDKTTHIADAPLLYYRTRAEIQTYAERPIEQKLQWLQAQMEFFFIAMPEKSKKIRDRLFQR